jgi:para-aminobenzoate synthetase component 1
MFGRESQFWMGGIHATNLKEVTDDPAKLDDGSFWAVSISFEGKAIFAKFSDVDSKEFPQAEWNALTGSWKSSLTETEYMAYVSAIKESIAEGGVYQVNACRQLHHPLRNEDQSIAGLFSQLLKGNPAPYSCYFKVEELEIASASPERFLKRTGSTILTSPIKGTIRQNEDSFGEKDKAENLMIVDLMRNDLGRICEAGTVDVPELFRHEKHPGITHLVSDVQGELRDEISWREILSIIPPGSVSGAPKSAAVSIIKEYEGVRGPYCGALGWIQGDRAELSVAIRTFWNMGDSILRFGTGAGITWGSDPAAEWEETELKARRLISLAGGEL